MMRSSNHRQHRFSLWQESSSKGGVPEESEGTASIAIVSSVMCPRRFDRDSLLSSTAGKVRRLTMGPAQSTPQPSNSTPPTPLQIELYPPSSADSCTHRPCSADDGNISRFVKGTLASHESNLSVRVCICMGCAGSGRLLPHVRLPLGVHRLPPLWFDAKLKPLPRDRSRSISGGIPVLPSVPSPQEQPAAEINCLETPVLSSAG